MGSRRNRVRNYLLIQHRRLYVDEAQVCTLADVFIASTYFYGGLIRAAPFEANTGTRRHTIRPVRSETRSRMLPAPPRLPGISGCCRRILLIRRQAIPSIFLVDCWGKETRIQGFWLSGRWCAISLRMWRMRSAVMGCSLRRAASLPNIPAPASPGE